MNRQPGWRHQAQVLALKLRSMLTSTLAWAAVVLLSPLLLCLVFANWLRKRWGGRRREAAVFRVRRRHLRERLTVQEVEARERVEDPLHAAPALPFGHQNEVWRTLTATLEPGDELWSFDTPWRNSRGRQEIRAGYVAWRRGKPAGYILTLSKAPKEPAALSNPPAHARRPRKWDPSAKIDFDGEVPAWPRRDAD